ncbi:hypothetical protein R3P38DRAFT_1530675 [Favolaschia claudopus]|uniref:Uncharacterized protein n=1 Tax=Favolaschia claudopus TaxID=2862362 RepID=A0AAW0ALG6_9AGAR
MQFQRRKTIPARQRWSKTHLKDIRCQRHMCSFTDGVAYTRFLVSDHKLAIEELRHANRSWRYVERESRLCRFCHAGVEDECHALLVCTGHPRLSRLRADFLRDVFTSQPDLRRMTSASAYDFLLTLVANHNLTAHVARLVYEVFRVYEEKELYVPPTHFIRADNP